MQSLVAVDSSQFLDFKLKVEKSFKRRFSLLLAIGLTSVLSACGGGSGDKKSKSSGPDEAPGLSSTPVIASSSLSNISSVASVSVASSAAISSLSIISSSAISSLSSTSSSAKSSLFSSVSSSSASSRASSSQISSAAFVGSAYLKTRHTILLKDRDIGTSRSVQQLLIDQCNLFRSAMYELPPLSPSAENLARLDIQIQEKFYADNQALTTYTGTGMILTDYRRWLDDTSDSKAPPDCSQATFPENKSGTLWRDGIKYSLRYSEKKAVGNKFTPSEIFLLSQTDYFALPVKSYLGQTCHEIPSNSTLVPDGHACMWDYIPYVGYLNWPFLLKGQVPFFPEASNLIETVEPLVVEQNAVLPVGIFDIPEGFSVIGLD